VKQTGRMRVVDQWIRLRLSEMAVFLCPES
jgi:hypothetical protein